MNKKILLALILLASVIMSPTAMAKKDCESFEFWRSYHESQLYDTTLSRKDIRKVTNQLQTFWNLNKLGLSEQELKKQYISAVGYFDLRHNKEYLKLVDTQLESNKNLITLYIDLCDQLKKANPEDYK